jgi:ATP-dependent protease ClpP protease subunit
MKSKLDEIDKSIDDVVINEENVTTEVFKYNVYHIYIDQEIGAPEKYRSALNILRKATSSDIINLIINSPGGSMATTMQLHNYLMMTEALTVAEIHSAYSGGAILALSCDKIIYTPYSSIMVHSSTSALFGKIHELDKEVEFVNRFNKTICKIYETFFSNEEIELVLKGKDIWLMSDDIEKRIKKWKPLRQRINKKDGENNGRANKASTKSKSGRGGNKN